MRKKRLFCALLALSLALGCCGCGKSGNDQSDLRAEAVRTTAAENVDRFVAEKISVDGWGEDFCLIGGEAVFLLGKGESKSLCAMGTDGENLRTLAPLDPSARFLAAGEDSTVWIMELAFGEDNTVTKNALRQFDTAGREIKTLSLLDVSGAWSAYGFTVADGTAWMVTSDGGWQLVGVDLKTGKQTLSLSVPDGAVLDRLRDGTVIVSFSEPEGVTFRPLDAKKKTLGESVTFPLHLWGFYDGSGDWDLYLNDGTNVYGYDRAAGTTKKLFNWSVMGIRGEKLAAFGDGEFFCLSSGEARDFYRLSPYIAPEGDGPVTVTIAVTDRTASLVTERKVNAWNQTHPELTIEIVDYSVYGDGDGFAAQTRLMADIVAGQGPDMYDFTPGIYGQFVDSTALAKVGLLENLMPYIEADETIRWEDLCLNVIQAAQLGGGLYELPVRYTFNTAVAPSSTGLEEGAGWEEIDAAFAACGGSFRNESSDYPRDGVWWLNEAVTVCGDKLVDWEKNTCYFDSPYFLRLLETAKRINGEKVDLETDIAPYLWQHQQAANAMLYCEQCQAVDFVDGEVALYGADFSYVGYPEVGSALVLTQSFGLSAASAHKQECWQFLRQFLLPEEGGYKLLFGVNRHDMEQAREEWKARRPPEGMSREEWESRRPTPLFTLENLYAGIDKLYDAVTSCRRLGRQDSTILGVIDETVPAYFDGARSAEETADIIQQKISLYLAELG